MAPLARRPPARSARCHVGRIRLPPFPCFGGQSNQHSLQKLSSVEQCLHNQRPSDRVLLFLRALRPVGRVHLRPGLIARSGTSDYGSNVRLATVLTDLSLAVDQPRDLGVDDLCAHCRICETNGPPHALFPEKQLVRGQQRWYVNFDKCAPYFAETRGRGICIEVYPWSTPGKGPKLICTLLERREGAGGAPRCRSLAARHLCGSPGQERRDRPPASRSLMLCASSQNVAARRLFERAGLRPTMVEMRIQMGT